MRRIVVGTALMAALAGCDGGTGPDTTGAGSLTLTSQVDGVILGSVDTIPSITCNFTLSATRSGSGAIAFENSNVYIASGPQRTSFTDTVVFFASDLNQAFGSGLLPGTPKATAWYVGGPFPFTAKIELRYRQGTATNAAANSATTTFDCGPTPAPGSPPVITNLTVTPASAVLPGDSLVVSYTASSSIGVWASLVAITSPCEFLKLFFDRSQPTVSRTVRFRIPPGCAANQPFTIAASAADYLVQSVLTTQDVSPPDPDGQAPTLSVTMTGDPGAQVTGQYFPGDTLKVRLSATDNTRVRAIYWGPAGTTLRDSLLAATATASMNLDHKALIRDSWPAGSSLVFYARDAGGLTSDTVRSGPDFAIAPTVTHPAVEGSVPGITVHALHDAKRGLIYLLDRANGAVRVVSPTTGSLVASVQLPSRADDMDFVPSGDSLVVTLPLTAQIVLVDLTSGTRPQHVVNVAFAGPESEPAYVRTTSTGLVLMSLRTSGGWALGEINLATGVQRVRTDGGASYIGRSADHSVLIFNGGTSTRLQRYDASGDSFGTPVDFPAEYIPVVAPAADRAAFGLDLFDGSLAKVAHVNRYWPSFTTLLSSAAFSADGQYVYHLAPPYIYRSASSDGRLLDRFAAPAGASHIWTTQDGRLVITRDANGAFAIVNLAS